MPSRAFPMSMTVAKARASSIGELQAAAESCLGVVSGFACSGGGFGVGVFAAGCRGFDGGAVGFVEGAAFGCAGVVWPDPVDGGTRDCSDANTTLTGGGGAWLNSAAG